MATRDAGVLAYGLGTDVHVAELHPRALTHSIPMGQMQTHPHTCRPTPVFIFTTNRKKASLLLIGAHRVCWATERYRYLGEYTSIIIGTMMWWYETMYH